MREMHVVLFLANHPAHDTARDVTELRGLAKSQVSAAVDLLAARELLRRQPDKADRRVIPVSYTHLVQQQYAEGIIQHYDYPEPVRTNWLLELLPFLLTAVILGLMWYLSLIHILETVKSRLLEAIDAYFEK